MNTHFLKRFTNLSSLTSAYRGKLIIKSYQGWLKKNDKVLDVGCGTGLIAKQLKNNFEVRIFGCDIKNYLIVDIPFKIMKNSTKLPFSPNSFDVAMLNDALHHMQPNIQNLIINECLRVAKKILIFEVKPTLLGFTFDLLLNKIHYGSLETPLSFKKIEEWQILFKKLGVKMDYKKVKRPFFYPFSHIAFYLERK